MPNAAKVPWTMLLLTTAMLAANPDLRPPWSVFLSTTAKSGPGAITSTAANARNVARCSVGTRDLPRSATARATLRAVPAADEAGGVTIL